ncbi:hypothetical protein GJAV_G00017790 [Gymnothorax javanicus]|nr:hypothetical protein GJAV_G00017790 [Gymnothorax javanicus]
MKAALLISKQVFWYLVIFLCVFKAVCPPIREEFKDYQCSHVKEGNVIVYSPEQNISLCDQYWDFGKKPIADLNRGECSRPCIYVSSAEIHLTDCINVTLKIVCTVPGHRIEESRVNFFGKPSSSQGQDHHIGLYCAGAAVCALLLCFICYAMKKGRPPCATDIQGPG